MALLRAEYLEILQRIASGASTKMLIQSIREKGVEADEVPKLLALTRAVMPTKEYKLIASVVVREGLARNVTNLPMIAELAPKTLPILRTIARHITESMNLEDSAKIRNSMSCNYKKRVWDRCMAEFLSKSQQNRIYNEPLNHGQLQWDKAASQHSEMELLQKWYNKLATMAKGMTPKELIDATLNLHQKGHLDVIVELMRLSSEDPAIGQLIKGAEVRVEAVDPGHWIWPMAILQRLQEGKDLPNLRKYIVANLLEGRMDTARMLFEMEQSKRDKHPWCAAWMSQIFKGWQSAGVQKYHP